MDEKKTEVRLLSLAKSVYLKADAYNHFLKRNGVTSVKEFPKKFYELPVIDKANYIEKYSVENKLLNSKKLSDYYMICTSSGSTGDPTIWPRDYELDKKAINFNYLVYKNLFHVDKKRTLVVVTFGLGAWTAGMLTSRLCWEMPKDVKVTVVTPGLDKEVTLRVIKQLSKYFDQTIITGYPPFIIDLVNYGKKKNFDFKKINTKIHFTSARLLESQRLVLAKAVSKRSSVYDVLGFYASSEAGIIGVEIPETIDILKLATKNKFFCNTLFKSTVPPSFVIYDPAVRFLEAHRGRILITVDQPIPLIRYDTKDRGGLFDSNFLSETCNKFGYALPSNLKGKNFVYIYGRSDSVRLLSNIYIDDILYCLNNSNLKNKLTGNFKYGLYDYGLKNILRVIVYVIDGKTISTAEKRVFNKKFVSDLANVNPDFKMVSSGIKFNFKIEFATESGLQYKGGKFDYHL